MTNEHRDMVMRGVVVNQSAIRLTLCINDVNHIATWITSHPYDGYHVASWLTNYA